MAENQMFVVASDEIHGMVHVTINAQNGKWVQVKAKETPMDQWMAARQIRALINTLDIGGINYNESAFRANTNSLLEALDGLAKGRKTSTIKEGIEKLRLAIAAERKIEDKESVLGVLREVAKLSDHLPTVKNLPKTTDANAIRAIKAILKNIEEETGDDKKDKQKAESKIPF